MILRIFLGGVDGFIEMPWVCWVGDGGKGDGDGVRFEMGMGWDGMGKGEFYKKAFVCFSLISNE